MNGAYYGGNLIWEVLTGVLEKIVEESKHSGGGFGTGMLYDSIEKYGD